MSTNARTAYLQGQGQSASPLRQIVLLYEQLIQDLRRATAAISEKNVEGRTNNLNHALAVLGELQGSLNMDAGGEVARNLARFYGVMRTGLLSTQFHPDISILEKHIASLLELREAWIEVERKNNSVTATENKVQATSPVESGSRSNRSGWNV